MRKVKPLLEFEFLGTENYQSSFHLWEDIEKEYMLTDVVEIHFLELPKFENYQSSFHLWEDIEKDYMLTDVVEIHFLELPKFRKKKDKEYRENAIERCIEKML